MKIVSKVFQIIMNIVVTIMIIGIIFASYNLFQMKILKKDYCNLFDYTSFQVATGSMSGTIEIKDVIIAKVENDDINVGDIVVYKKQGYTVTHRIIKMDGDNIVTKGDANNTEDEPINRSAVIGKVIKIIPNIAIWEKVFTTPKVYISIIITIIFFALVCSISDKGTEEDDDVQNSEKSSKVKSNKNKAKHSK